jgi:hypothetical protein
MSEELKQAGGNEALEKSGEIEATLSGRQHVYDLARHTYLGYTNRLHFTLDPWQPSLFALVASKSSEQSLIEELTPK